MARYSGGDGMTKVMFLLSVANISSVTLGELGAGVDWSGFIMKDGLSEPSDQNNTPVASLADTFNAQVPGRLLASAIVTWNPQDKCEKRLGQKHALTKAINYLRGLGCVTTEGSGAIWEKWLALKGAKQ